MRYVVHGAGGIGGVIGARLDQAGHTVTLIARGPHLDAIRDRGLTIEDSAGAETLRIPAVGGPSEVEDWDDTVVLLAMKSQDTPDALRALAAAAPPGTPVVCAQNGVENERAAVRLFDRVYAMCVMCPTNHLEPGIVQAYSAPCTGLLDLGRYPDGVDAVAIEVAAALRGATFESEPRPDIMRWKYTKLLMNLGNSIDALCGPGARGTGLFGRVRDEGIAVLRTAGIDFVSEEQDAGRRGDLVTMRRVGGERRGGGSTWQSLARGKSSVETDYLNGEIVLLGRLHGVPTPVNEMLQSAMREAARDGREPGTVPPDELEARLARV